MHFCVESDGDFVEVDIEDGDVQLRFPNEGARKFGEALLTEAEESGHET